MSRGRRYEEGEPQLNWKKVFGVIGVVVVLVLFVIGIKKILNADKNKLQAKNIPLNYFTVFSNNNWGVINSSGEVIIKPENSEMIQIPNKAKPVFVCTYEVNYAEGTFKTKAINEKNETIFTNYDNVSVIGNSDEFNNVWYEENILKVQKDGKYGLINLDGAEVLPCEYDSIDAVKNVKNSIIIRKGEFVGLANSNGNIVIPAEYAEISAISKDSSDGYIVKNSESKYGIFDSEGKNVLEVKFEKITSLKDDDKYVVCLDGKWQVIAKDGTSYLEGKVENALDMKNGNVIIRNGKCGVLTIGEEEIIPFEYEDLKFLFADKYIAKKDGKYGIITAKNEGIIDFKYSEMISNKNTEYVKAKNDDGTFDYISKDMVVKFTADNEEFVGKNFISVKINNETKFYNYRLDEKTNKDVYTSNTLYTYKQNGKYGYKNKDGKVIVEAKYEDATEQNEYGFVSVKKDGKWGCLDQYGKVVCDTKFDLSKNQKIDFIGKWHLCVDKNANFYTE